MASPTRWIRQAAAVPVRDGQVCLITSSTGRRWIIPKGMMEPDKTAAEIAVQEAWEEAGLVGALRPEPIGSYFYQKYGGTCHVTVYLMQVTAAHDDWPEASLRRRAWFAPDEALALIQDPGLYDLMEQVFQSEGNKLADAAI